jgi:uncharacterized protein YjbI with pentapeptide repeats/DNA-binding CsgD family transcriptional regulator
VPETDNQWTERERQVLDLIARGCTNGQIAERLGISFATAKWHVSEIISKLGVQSREEVAAYWVRQRAPWRRVSRAIGGLGLPLALKAGLGVAGIAGVAGAIVFAVDIAHDDDLDEVEWSLTTGKAVAQMPTPSPTPTPAHNSSSRPTGCPQPPFPAGASRLCRYSEFPEIAALDRGGCDFSGIDLSAVMTAPGRYEAIDFSGCNLGLTNLTNVWAHGASFAGAYMFGARMDGGSFANADFREADLREARLSAVLAGANFASASIAGALAYAVQADTARWSSTVCPDGNNSDANPPTCIGLGVVLVDPRSASNRPGGDVCPPPPNVVQWAARCDRSHYPPFAALVPGGPDCDLRGADLSGQHLESIDLASCNLTGADLSGSALDGAYLAGANLDRANLSGATLGYADLSGASLRGTNMADASLYLTETSNVALDATTICPSGAPVLAPSHGPCF